MEYWKKILLFSAAVLLFSVNLISCGTDSGSVVIDQPDQYRHIYEANEKIILNAAARIFRDKAMGRNVKIDLEKKQVETDYAVEGEWRTKSILKVKKLNWKEREVVLSVITEKKTENGWEMRRLLEKEQYVSLFDKIDLAIYEEMSKVQ